MRRARMKSLESMQYTLNARSVLMIWYIIARC